jgi:hypothetical protein
VVRQAVARYYPSPGSRIRCSRARIRIAAAVAITGSAAPGDFVLAPELPLFAADATRMPEKSTPTSAPLFLTPDPRTPAAVRELLVEADGCLKAGFLTGGTACAQRAIQALLQHEGADGASYEARLHALSKKYPSVPQSLFALCIRLGDSPAKDQPALDVERLKVLTVALKIMLYEIYVLGPDRTDRLKYLQQMVEACEAGGHGRQTVVAFPS